MLKRGLPPVHPGEILKEMWMEPIGLSQAEFAKNLGVTRKTLSMLLNEHQGVSAEMALRLSKALNTSPDLWLNLQRDFDLWHAEKKVNLSKIKAYRHTKNTPTEAAVLKRTA